MRNEDTYKYLGMKQSQRIEHQTMKAELTKEFIKRVRLLARTSLNSKNLFKAIKIHMLARCLDILLEY